MVVICARLSSLVNVFDLVCEMESEEGAGSCSTPTLVTARDMSTFSGPA